jgi:prepilin-type N-terminal cleavage/methylation domain-containing protein
VAGRVSARFQINPRKRPGFSLIEVLIVVLIMGIVLGMTGSLLGGFYNMFEASEDQSSARMRAQSVFNILAGPIQSAGIGIPSRDLSASFTFGAVSFGMKDWPAPLSIASGDNTLFNRLAGEQLRVIYGVPTGLKYTGGTIEAGVSPDTGISVFSGFNVNSARQIGNKQVLYVNPGSPPKIDPYGMMQWDLTTSLGNGATSMLLAFPGTNMMPARVDTADGSPISTMKISVPSLNYVPTDDYTGANTIKTNHDIFLLRGAWAYVDDYNTFCFLNIYDNTFSDVSGVPVSPPPASHPDFSGFMIDGIAGIWFETDTTDPQYQWRYVKVEVLAEGDTLDEKRAASMAALKDTWEKRGVTFKPGVYYEGFSRVFRTRNIQRGGGSGVSDKESQAAAYLIRAVFVDGETGSEKSIETAIVQSMRE